MLGLPLHHPFGKGPLHGSGWICVMSGRPHHSKTILGTKKIHEEIITAGPKITPQRATPVAGTLSAILVGPPGPSGRLPTFSSLLATLKANSVTLPAAQRAALEECSSFQMVSLSTCKQGNGQTGMGKGYLSWGTHALCQSPCSEGHPAHHGASSSAPQWPPGDGSQGNSSSNPAPQESSACGAPHPAPRG